MILTEKIIRELTDVLQAIDAQVPEIRKHLEEKKKPIGSFSREKNVPGIYAFFIKPKNGVDLYSFEDLWLDKDIKNYPKVVHSRFQAATQEKKKIYTLYLGKSEKVDARINEHLTLHAQSNTYALKLLIRPKLLKAHDIYYARYEMKELIGLESSILQFVITRLELRLRGGMLPLGWETVERLLKSCYYSGMRIFSSSFLNTSF